MHLSLLGQIAEVITQYHSKQLLTNQNDDDHVCTMFACDICVFFDELLVQIIKATVYCLCKCLIEVMRCVNFVNFTMLPQSLN